MALAPWDAYTPEAKAEWENQFGTEVEIEAKKANIDREGLTAMVHLEMGPWRRGRRLWILELNPIPDKWTDMRKPDKMQAYLNYEHYPISIPFNDDIITVWQQRMLDELWNEYREPFEYKFYVENWGGGVTANIKHDQVWGAVHDLHRTGSYKTGQIHISM